jgi:hypothetical protein
MQIRSGPGLPYGGELSDGVEPSPECRELPSRRTLRRGGGPAIQRCTRGRWPGNSVHRPGSRTISFLTPPLSFSRRSTRACRAKRKWHVGPSQELSRRILLPRGNRPIIEEGDAAGVNPVCCPLDTADRIWDPGRLAPRQEDAQCQTCPVHPLAPPPSWNNAKLGTLRAGFVGSSAVGKAANLPDLNSHAVTISISTDQSAKLAQAAGGGPVAGATG